MGHGVGSKHAMKQTKTSQDDELSFVANWIVFVAVSAMCESVYGCAVMLHESRDHDHQCNP